MQFFTYEQILELSEGHYGRVYDRSYTMSYFKKLDKKINKQYFFKHMPRINTRRLSSQIWMNAISETGDVNYGCTAEFMAIMLKEALLCDIPEELRKIISDYCYRGIKNYNFVYDNHTMFWYMKRYMVCYPETLFHVVGRLKISDVIGYPAFLLYGTEVCSALHKKRPDETGTFLEDCTIEESDMASGDYRTPEERKRGYERAMKKLIIPKELRKKGYGEDEIRELIKYFEDNDII